MMRRAPWSLLVACAFVLTGCKAHHLFGPTKPSLTRTPRDYTPDDDKCYFTITTADGVVHRYEIPCDD